MSACLDRLRWPGRGGAVSLLSLSYAALTPFLLQPLIAVASVTVTSHIAIIVSVLIAMQMLTASYMGKRNARSQFLHYWTLSAIIYSIILFESSVTPLLEIRSDENLVIVVLSILAIGFLYRTKKQANGSVIGDSMLQGNGGCAESICPVCRIKVYPRCVHCLVCSTCVPRYDHHCFWLDCCIGENNQLLFMLGLLFSAMALIYGSLLSLTTICRPIYVWGILFPHDCADATDDLEVGVCYMSALYCLGLSVPVLIQLCHHIWLVSRGLSGEEWRIHGYRMNSSNPYSRGCFGNWVHLVRRRPR